MRHTIQGVNSTLLMKSCASVADDRGGQERDQHAEDEAARSGIARQRHRDRHSLREIDRQDGQDRAELDQHHEGLAEGVVVEAEEVLEQQQMAGRRDRQELGQPLDHAENDGLEEVEHDGAPSGAAGHKHVGYSAGHAVLSGESGTATLFAQPHRHGNGT